MEGPDWLGSWISIQVHPALIHVRHTQNITEHCRAPQPSLTECSRLRRRGDLPRHMLCHAMPCCAMLCCAASTDRQHHGRTSPKFSHTCCPALQFLPRYCRQWCLASVLQHRHCTRPRWVLGSHDLPTYHRHTPLPLDRASRSLSS